MNTILIANIGNRDVWVDKGAPIPGKVNPRWNKDASRRALGEALQTNWPACQPYLSLPIIGKAVNYVRQQSDQLDQVVLISSDQSGREGVAGHHLAQDTCELAPVVERLLVEQYEITADGITHLAVRDNPADYSDMRGFFRQHLAGLCDEHPGATFYLEVSGGTPAMTSMLLTVGAELFGLDAHPLYVSEQEEQPFPLDLGRRLVADSLVKTIEANLDIYAYHAAANTARNNLDLLRDFVPVDPLLAALEYARQRINFNFDRARGALNEVSVIDWAERLEELDAGLGEGQPEWLLREICHNAQVKLNTGAYGDFLTRMFRFDEATLRYTACKLGARLIDEKENPDADGEFLDAGWLDSESDLEKYLDSKKVRRNNAGLIKTTRFVFSLIVAFWSKRRSDPALQALRKHLNKIDKLSAVRNKSFAVHTFEGVSRQRMAEAFIGPGAMGTDEEIDQIWNVVRAACEVATGQPLDETNPYTTINQLILELLAS